MHRKRIQFAEHTLTESQKATPSSSNPPQGSTGNTGSISGTQAGGPNASTSIPSFANANRRPASTRRKKSIRITLDDDRDAKSDAGSISSMIERNKLRFEDSPTTPVTPLGSKGSIASNDTSLFDDKVSCNNIKRYIGILQTMTGLPICSTQLRLLSISDASTGMCLFKCTWNWRRNTNVDGVGSLVQSFYQFAREIGDGGECGLEEVPYAVCVPL